MFWIARAEAADADLVGQVMAWAAEAPQAANEIFNVTNGDVFEWRSVWPALAETLGVKLGPDEPASLAAYLRDNAELWSKIVAKYGLISGDLRAFAGQGDQHADFAFAYGAPAGPVAFVSTVKLRKAGFNAANLLEKTNDWKSAVAVYRKLAAVGGTRSEEAKARLTQLRLEHRVPAAEAQAVKPRHKPTVRGERVPASEVSDTMAAAIPSCALLRCKSATMNGDRKLMALRSKSTRPNATPSRTARPS